MARPGNQATGAGNTNKPRKPRPPKQSQLDRVLKWDPSHLAAILQAGGTTPQDFQGQGRYEKRQTIRQALDAFRNQNNPAYFAQPQTLAQAYQAADSATRLKYGGVESALNQQITQTPQWYANYKNSLAAARTAAQTYQQGLIGQSEATAQQVSQAVLPGNAQDEQAAKSRQALANLGTDLIRAGGAANDQYFGARPAVADASQMSAMAKLFAQQQQLAGEKADYRTSTLNELRQNAANNYLAQQTLAGNQANQQADNAFQAANAAQQAHDRAAQRRVTRKNARDRLAAQGERQAAADQKAAEKEAAKQAAADAKKTAAIKGATGKITNKLNDAADWGYSLVGTYAEDESLPIDPATGKHKTREITKNDVHQLVTTKYGMLGRIALAIRDGRPLDQKAIDYLHGLDPNFRVPRAWLRKPIQRPGNAPSGTRGQSRPT